MKATLLILMAVVLVGCATGNWNDLVGKYTYEQAVIDYGPPSASENLSNGRKVVSWTLSRARNWTDKLVLVFDENGKMLSGGERRY
jgi:hypothetical protein